MRDFVSVKTFAMEHGVSERTVRNYCAEGRIPGAYIVGKTWNIPFDAALPQRKNARTVKESALLQTLKEQKRMSLKGGIYHRTQIDLTYNSNHMEGSRLTHEQTRYIFETHTVGELEGDVRVDDIIETVNHFRCVDMVIDHATEPLSEAFVKTLHRTLKQGTVDSRKEWFRVGDYKMLPNEVGGMRTAMPEDVAPRMKSLLEEYDNKKNRSLEDIIDFHHKFESIHPFQDGNGRVGRLVMFKECLRFGIVPFIITDELKSYYYRGLRNWPDVPGYLMDTCLTAQDAYKAILDYFRIPY